MSSRNQQVGIKRLLQFFRQWDRGSAAARSRMLEAFVGRSLGDTGPELELRFAQSASLFLARITAWIRLHYMFGTYLGLQLRAVGVFLSASNSHRYLTEFLEVGGVLTLLEILNQKQIKDEDKTEALRLLQIISDAGRKYKELICESFGVRVIVECLAKSTSVDTKETASVLLESLAHGNYKYQEQVYKGLVALLQCTSPKAQQLALQNLRIVHKIVNSAHPNIVEPLLNMLKSLNLEVQYEAIELIRDLMSYDEVKPALLKGLVALLKPVKKEPQQYQILKDPERINMTTSLPVSIQQAAAAKAIREHADSQKQACLALKQFVHTHPVLVEHVQAAMGITLFDLFMNNPEALYMKMNGIQADILVSNKMNISEGLEECAR
ncbi:armadillo-like helical domain containing protein 1 isoform X2 [Brienomyrus brachyistius]|uniref:armadillo-like helical domain containing protein 1 isoform X2 n=1 Tax=Brienomyrus brachyistius TaxID=42636 RepID=UPI0020B23F35|nr:armadillo-like helical domain containing protein 1 isoform X2 [Brienomyrus brachyistius]